MRVFLDFEASSLNDDSFPIEVGWVFEDGREEAHLIRPAPAWTDWDATAASIQGITRALLISRGEPHDVVARRLLDELAPHSVFVSAPSWDGKWLSVLLRAAGLPRHAMRFRDSDEAMSEAARQGLAGSVAEPLLGEAADELVRSVRSAGALRPIAHRALADARQEWKLWLEVRDLAQARARTGA
jgi:hypothetical protein